MKKQIYVLEFLKFLFRLKHIIASTCFNMSISSIDFENKTEGGGFVRCKSLMLLIHASNFLPFFSTFSIDAIYNK
jgi:hypothetical protein